MKPRHVRHLMAGASSFAIMTAGSQAFAQETSLEGAGEDIVIATGIIQSLERAVDIKRDASGIVDAINAEDIGKFPDTNLAESLQRITGVSIDRANGEGNTVTVRGFGADYNLVTFNGRQMPTASLGDGASAPSSRSFDFGNIASEGISAVEVYKTSRADVASGGIGATINIRTARPLDTLGQRGTIGVKGVLDTSRNEGNPVTPEISGLYSSTFADDKFGISIFGSYQGRKASVNEAGAGWRDGYLGSENNWGTLAQSGDPRNANIINDPEDGDVYAVPQNAFYAIRDIQRERINGQVTLQYAPTDRITATADYVFSQNTVEVRNSDLGIWFNHGDTSSAWTDGPNAAPLFYSEDFGAGPSDLSYGGALTENRTTNHSVGGNIEWQATDRLSLFIDAHDSSAEAEPNNPFGSSVSIGTAVYGLQTQTVNFEQDLPVISFTNAAGINSEDPANRVATGNAFRNAYQRTDIQQLRFGGSYEVDRDIIDSVDFGVGYIENRVRSAFNVVQNDTWGGLGSPDDFPDSLFEFETLPDKFDGISGANNPAMVQGFYTFDFEDMFSILNDQFSVCGGDGSCIDDPYTTDRRFREETLSGFVQVNTSFDLNGQPANIVAGARYEETKVDSSALVGTRPGSEWSAVNEFNLQDFSDSDFTSADGKYSFFLPNFNADWEVVDDVKLRATYSRTITRPTYQNLQGGLSLDGLFRIGGGNGNRGNPGLLPNLSGNYDVSAEWYYSPASYVSAGYFRKNVENFIGSDRIDLTSPGLTHPGLGPRAAAARQALGTDDLGLIRQWIFDNTDPSGFVVTGTDANGNTTGTIFGLPEDPLINFEVAIPVANDQTATLDGFELALQHTFGDSGFGFIANYTIVNGDFEYDNTQPASAGAQFVLPGLSDSANLIGFYDKNGLQARVAYNWRDEFFSGGDVNPFYVEAFGQVDANVSYEFREGFTAFVEVINLTGEGRRGHRRTDNNVTFVQPGDARWGAGLRYNF